METNRKKLSPQEQLANVCDSLADDALAGHVEISDTTNQRASRVARNAINQALSSGSDSDSVAESSQTQWAKRTGKDALPPKGPLK
jgi:hypothetical protein